ncbi:hypothetical protein LX36DRAFT_249938 [Colletotrichum falcatum]|nr:hypothetical protein LX36DRAFT_249938 [Colletotrichum falcatum]
MPPFLLRHRRMPPNCQAARVAKGEEWKKTGGGGPKEPLGQITPYSTLRYWLRLISYPVCRCTTARAQQHGIVLGYSWQQETSLPFSNLALPDSDTILAVPGAWGQPLLLGRSVFFSRCQKTECCMLALQVAIHCPRPSTKQPKPGRPSLGICRRVANSSSILH